MDVGDTVQDFLEAAIPLILYKSSVYPPEVFEERRKHGAPVFVSRHTGLHDYIAHVVASIRPWLRQGAVERIHVLLMGDDGVVHERFVLQVAVTGADQPATAEVSAMLRSFLLKINAYQPPPHSGIPTSFRVAIDCPRAQASETPEWLRADEDTSDETSQPSARVVVPLRSSAPYHTPGLRMQLWAEHAPAPDPRTSQPQSPHGDTT